MGHIEIVYKDYAEYKERTKVYCIDKCRRCDNKVEMVMEAIVIKIANRTINISSLPMLKCIKCAEYGFPEYSKRIVMGLYNELIKRNNLEVISDPNGYRKKYEYAQNNNFIYDHRDYESIPGLTFDEEHEEEGFLTPVYFEKRALIYFITVPEYEVDLFSETYGIIKKKCNDGYWQWEWDAPFGINTNGKMIFWLGDLDSMDELSRSILRPFNIESDHLLTESEFYDAQMNCIFSEPITEIQIVNNKKIFVDKINKKYNIDLSHLVKETGKHEEEIQRPIIFNEQSISPIINSFDKILIEGINCVEFRKLYEIIYPNDRHKGYGEWQSIRCYEAFVSKYINDFDIKEDLRSIMAPLYLVHDLRIYFDHLLSEDKQNKKKENILRTLEVDSFDQIEKIYYLIIEKLNKLFQLAVLFAS